MGVKALRDLVTPTGADAYVPGHGDTSFDVLEYALELDYDVDGNRLRGKAVITAEAVQDLESFELDLRGLKVDKVTVRSYGAAKHSHHRGRLRVRLRRAVPEGSTFVCTVVYGGHPTPVGSRWGTLGWEELTDGAIVASQPAGAPSWFPCNDRPSDKAGYTLAITVPSDYTVVANGAPSRPRRRASSTTWAFDQREPMATYLATVQVGRYESWTTSAGDVTLRHVVPARLRQRYGHDFGRQAEMVAVFEERFGAYPFAAGYTVVVTDDELEIPLEAQGLSVFGANHLDGERRHERLVAHELAHQWFGNALTLTTWDQIWLHEGFACYAEWLWSEASGGRPAAELATHWHGRLSELDQDVVLADPGPEGMFDDRVYKRGALLLHALRRRVGDDAFFDLVRSWVARHRHANVTTDGFREHVASATGEDLDDLFDAWLLATALPPLP